MTINIDSNKVKIIVLLFAIPILLYLFWPLAIATAFIALFYKRLSKQSQKLALLLPVIFFTLLIQIPWYVVALIMPFIDSIEPSPAVEQQEVLSEKDSQETAPQEVVAPEIYALTKFVDGDTVDLEEIGRIRLIGIDSPEVSGSGGEQECYATESTEGIKAIVGTLKVYVEYDESQGMKDKYDRTLAYLFTENGLNINEEMLKRGFAAEYTYDKDYKYKDAFLKAQESAKENKRGMWSDLCACEKGAEVSSECGGCKERVIVYSNWDCSSYEESVEDVSCTVGCPVVAPPVSTPTPAPTPPPVTTACLYSCSSPDRNCSDFSSHAQAQAFFVCCGFSATYDPMRLDGSGVDDGIACESLP